MDYLLKEGEAYNREEAVMIGRKLLESDTIRHGMGYKNNFDTGHNFFRLTQARKCNLMTVLTLLHSEQPKLYGVLTVLSALELRRVSIKLSLNSCFCPFFSKSNKY